MPPQHYSQSNYMYINNTHGMRNDRLHVSTRLKGNYLPVGFSYSPCLVAILKALTFHSQTCRKMSKEADFINTLLLFIFFVCFFFFFFIFSSQIRKRSSLSYSHQPCITRACVEKTRVQTHVSTLHRSGTSRPPTSSAKCQPCDNPTTC